MGELGPGADELHPLFPRLTRRQFLKFCGALGVLIGAGRMAAADIAEGLEQLARKPNVAWSLFQECLGCSVNLLQCRAPQVATIVLQTISLNYHEAVMASAGFQADANFNDMVKSGDFYYIVEGAIATKIPEAMTVAGRTSMDIVTEAYKSAKATICIGSCSCFGNIQAAAPNPTGAKGVRDFLRQDAGIADAQTINLSRCPGNAEDLMAAIASVLYYGKLPELDAIGRPKSLYGGLIHDNCERRAHYENSEFVTHLGDPNANANWCWFEMGCKGPVSYAPCPITRWNGKQNWCIGVGPCIGCSEPAFWDKFTPFYAEATNAKLPGVTVPVFGSVSAQDVGIALGVATAVGLGAHAVTQVATGRWGHGAPLEPPSPEPPGTSPIEEPPAVPPPSSPVDEEVPK